LNKDHPLNSRKTKRHNHVFIRLKIKTKNDWVWIKAQNWSETGFSFNFDFNLEESEAQFRKGKAIFTGEIIWNRINYDKLNDSDDIYLETILNTMIYKKIRQQESGNLSAGTIMKLIRTDGRLEDKLDLLPRLGIDVSEEKLYSLIEEYKRECNIVHRYGVKTDSSAWADVVKETLESSSEFDDVDKMLESLSKMFK